MKAANLKSQVGISFNIHSLIADELLGSATCIMASVNDPTSIHHSERCRDQAMSFVATQIAIDEFEQGVIEYGI